MNRTSRSRRATAGRPRSSIRSARTVYAARDDAGPARQPRHVRGGAVGRPSWTRSRHGHRHTSRSGSRRSSGQDDGDMNCPAYRVRRAPVHCRSSGSTRGPTSSPMLKAMGMRDAVDPQRAPTSPASPAAGTCTSRIVIHQANIDVDENGTEAAAATAVGMDTTGGCGPPSRAEAQDAPLRPARSCSSSATCRPARSCSWVASSTRRSADAAIPSADGYLGRASQAFQVASALPAVTSSP